MQKSRGREWHLPGPTKGPAGLRAAGGQALTMLGQAGQARTALCAAQGGELFQQPQPGNDKMPLSLERQPLNS